MSKKSINDDDFFDDANIDALAEDIVVADPDLDGEAVSDDAGDDGESVADAEDSEAGDDPAGDQGDEEPGDDAVGDGDTDAASDPAPHLNDLDTAKVAYAELRKWANQRDMEARKAAERVAELEAIPEYDYQEEPQYDPQAFTHLATQDPQAAFEYALQSGSVADAQAAIAKVHTDANEMAAMAAIANQNGDREAYAHLNAQAVNVAALAQSLQGRLSQAQQETAQAPIVRWQRQQAAAQAEYAVAQQLGDAYTARRAQVAKVLQDDPTLIKDYTPEGYVQGIRKALAIAKDFYPDPVTPQQGAAPTLEDLDKLVASKLEERSKAVRQAKAAAADAAGGASDSRAGSATKAQQPTLKDELYDSARQQSVGARGFMSL